MDELASPAFYSRLGCNRLNWKEVEQRFEAIKTRDPYDNAATTSSRSIVLVV